MDVTKTVAYKNQVFYEGFYASDIAHNAVVYVDKQDGKYLLRNIKSLRCFSNWYKDYCYIEEIGSLIKQHCLPDEIINILQSIFVYMQNKYAEYEFVSYWTYKTSVVDWGLTDSDFEKYNIPLNDYKELAQRFLSETCLDQYLEDLKEVQDRYSFLHQFLIEPLIELGNQDR
jgi:hypothetical protein